MHIDGLDMEEVHENRFVGVIINNKISCKSHIKHTVLTKAKHILDLKSLHILYCWLISLCSNYCAEGFISAYKCSILQRRRVCVGGSLILDINPLFLKSKIQKFSDQVKFKAAQIMYKALNNLLTHSMLKLFSRE